MKREDTTSQRRTQKILLMNTTACKLKRVRVIPSKSQILCFALWLLLSLFLTSLLHIKWWYFTIYQLFQNSFCGRQEKKWALNSSVQFQFYLPCSMKLLLSNAALMSRNAKLPYLALHFCNWKRKNQLCCRITKRKKNEPFCFSHSNLI